MVTDSVYSTASKTPQTGNAIHQTGTQNPETSTRRAKKLKPCLISSGSVEVDALFEIAGQEYNISPDLLKAVAKVSSNFQAHATSKDGAMGIMQLMPGTAKYLGVRDPYDAKQNIMGGAKYLRQQLDRFGGNAELAVAAYKAGWGTVQKHGGIPPFKETQAFVPKVLSYLGAEDITANALTYEGFDIDGRISEVFHDKSSFNFNEALAQMFFMKLIEKQMNAKVSAIFPDKL